MTEKAAVLYKKLSDEIRQEVSQKLDLGGSISDDDVMDLVTDAVFNLSKKEYLDIAEKRELADMVFNTMRRLDILQPLMDDKSITEIMVNGPGKIFIEKEGRVFRLEISFENRQKLEDVIQSIVSKTNRTVNEASPIVDISMPDGSRVNVVLKPVALNGPIITIRKFPEKPMTLNELTAAGSLSAEAADELASLVRARYNIFICGGTGSGKTTFLNALSACIPSDERLVTIEDSAELQIDGVENLVRLETRNANSEGIGRITMRDLIKTSLRMRPERIIIGEVRGEEALDMLQAMNTGHDGSLSTGHANSAADMLKRLETMVLSAAPLPLDAVRQQIASAIDIVIHLSRLRDKSRRVLEISEITGYYDGTIHLNPLYLFEDSGTLANTGDGVQVPAGRRGVAGTGAAGFEQSDGITENVVQDSPASANTGKSDTAGKSECGRNAVQGRLVWTGNRLSDTRKLRMAGISCKLGDE